jgi:hypothetical protein
MVKRMDLSLVQDVFGKRGWQEARRTVPSRHHELQHTISQPTIGAVSQRLVVPVTAANGAQILTNPGVDAQGRVTYRLQVANGQLVTKSFQTTHPERPETRRQAATCTS